MPKTANRWRRLPSATPALKPFIPPPDNKCNQSCYGQASIRLAELTKCYCQALRPQTITNSRRDPPICWWLCLAADPFIDDPATQHDRRASLNEPAHQPKCWFATYTPGAAVIFDGTIPAVCHSSQYYARSDVMCCMYSNGCTLNNITWSSKLPRVVRW